MWLFRSSVAELERESSRCCSLFSKALLLVLGALRLKIHLEWQDSNAGLLGETRERNLWGNYELFGAGLKSLLVAI